MLEELKNIICEFVDIEPEAIRPESSLRGDLGATSVDLRNIAVEVETRYGVRVPDEKLPLIKTVGDILALL